MVSRFFLDVFSCYNLKMFQRPECTFLEKFVKPQQHEWRMKMSQRLEIPNRFVIYIIKKNVKLKFKRCHNLRTVFLKNILEIGIFTVNWLTVSVDRSSGDSTIIPILLSFDPVWFYPLVQASVKSFVMNVVFSLNSVWNFPPVKK